MLQLRFCFFIGCGKSEGSSQHVCCASLSGSCSGIRARIVRWSGGLHFPLGAAPDKIVGIRIAAVHTNCFLLLSLFVPGTQFKYHCHRLQRSELEMQRCANTPGNLVQFACVRLVTVRLHNIAIL